VSDDRRSSRRPGPDAFGHFTCICASTAPCYDLIVVRRPDWANRLWSDQAPERAPGKATRRNGSPYMRSRAIPGMTYEW
jgi:hypothetical protein